jgi:Fic family protein
MIKIFGPFAKNDERIDICKYSENDVCNIKFSNVCGKILHKIFDKFAYSTNEKFVPEKVFKFSIKLRLELLSALVDDDGSILNKRITIRQTDDSLVDGIVRLLTSLNIKANVGKTSENEKSFGYKDGHIHTIQVYGYKELRFLSKLLNLSHPNKIEKLERLKQKYQNIKPKRRKGELEKEIISFLRRKQNVSSTEISTSIKAHGETVREYLVKLHKNGVVRRIGTSSRTRYSLYENHMCPSSSIQTKA